VLKQFFGNHDFFFQDYLIKVLKNSMYSQVFLSLDKLEVYLRFEVHCSHLNYFKNVFTNFFWAGKCDYLSVYGVRQLSLLTDILICVLRGWNMRVSYY